MTKRTVPIVPPPTKNFSLLILPQTSVRLAPMYDVASTLPYDLSTNTRMDRMALTIGGKCVFGEIRHAQWVMLAKAAGVDEDRIISRVRSMAACIPDAIADAIARSPNRTDAQRLSEKLMPPLQTLCTAAQNNQPVPKSALFTYAG